MSALRKQSAYLDKESIDLAINLDKIVCKLYSFFEKELEKSEKRDKPYFKSKIKCYN